MNEKDYEFLYEPKTEFVKRISPNVLYSIGLVDRIKNMLNEANKNDLGSVNDNGYFKRKRLIKLLNSMYQDVDRDIQKVSTRIKIIFSIFADQKECELDDKFIKKVYNAENFISLKTKMQLKDIFDVYLNNTDKAFKQVEFNDFTKYFIDNYERCLLDAVGRLKVYEETLKTKDLSNVQFDKYDEEDVLSDEFADM